MLMAHRHRCPELDRDMEAALQLQGLRMVTLSRTGQQEEEEDISIFKIERM